MRMGSTPFVAASGIGALGPWGWQPSKEHTYRKTAIPRAVERAAAPNRLTERARKCFRKIPSLQLHPNTAAEGMALPALTCLSRCNSGSRMTRLLLPGLILGAGAVPVNERVNRSAITGRNSSTRSSARLGWPGRSRCRYPTAGSNPTPSSAAATSCVSSV
jgi:hypothetical protein